MKLISIECKDLIRRMLKPQDERISIKEIFDHPWMNTELKKAKLKLNYGKIINFAKYSKLKTFAVSYIASQLSGK